jgi:hypothetical protein
MLRADEQWRKRNDCKVPPTAFRSAPTVIKDVEFDFAVGGRGDCDPGAKLKIYRVDLI